MEKYFMWYRLQLKAWLRRKSLWFNIFAMILVVMIIGAIEFPDKENTCVGIYNAEAGYAYDIFCDLLEKDSGFQFVEYTDAESLKDDVLSGRLECGFAFCGDFNERFSREDIEDTVEYISTAFSTKGSVAGEVFSSSFFKIFSNVVLVNDIELYLDNSSEEIERYLIDANNFFIEGDEIFNINVQEVDTLKTQTNTYSAYPVKGAVGVMIFICVITGIGRKFEEGRGILYALDRIDGLIFRFIEFIASAAPIALAGILLIFIFGESGSVLREVFSMLFLVVISGLWALVIDCFINKSETFAVSSLAVVVVNILVCPVFFDLSEFIPAVRYISYIFPAGIYLRI